MFYVDDFVRAWMRGLVLFAIPSHIPSIPPFYRVSGGNPADVMHDVFDVFGIFSHSTFPLGSI